MQGTKVLEVEIERVLCTRFHLDIACWIGIRMQINDIVIYHEQVEEYMLYVLIISRAIVYVYLKYSCCYKKIIWSVIILKMLLTCTYCINVKVL
jgi:hypothetical protein